MTPAQPAESFLAKLEASLADGSFVRLVFSGPVRAGGNEKASARLIELRGRPFLSVNAQRGTANSTVNIPASEAVAWGKARLHDEFRSALLHTTRHDWQLHLPEGGPARITRHKPAFKTSPSRTHDEPGQLVLDASANDWLHGLGVTDANGHMRAAMSGKHRQINRYLEILSHLARDCGWLPDQSAGLRPDENRAVFGRLTLVDMGCGKGYLTFGAWQLFRRVHGLNVHVLGVEARPELVELTNALAKRIKADGLRFQPGTIESAELPAVDGLIALHACNTATDDAIRRGIELGAKLIVVAPCCHKELRSQLGKPKPLAAVLRHGIMEERMAEWLTDGLRALFLEWAGYRTKVFEFIASEHTPKNLMIAAIREAEPFADDTARERIVELKQFFGVQRHALDPLLAATRVGQASSLSAQYRQDACSTLDEPQLH